MTVADDEEAIMISVNSSWHSDYIKSCKKRSTDSLLYIIQDCRNAIEAMPDNPKCGQYQDEIHYCAMELRRRYPAKTTTS